jgi:hypothetical protein
LWASDDEWWHNATRWIDPIKIAKAGKMIEAAEVTVSKLERATTAKGNIAYGANAFAERACYEHHAAVNALKKLHNQAAEGASGNMRSSSSSVSSQGTMTTPQSTSTISLTPTRMTTATITPGTIIPGNLYVWASSLLHHKTAAALREINIPREPEDMPMELVADSTEITIGGRAILTSTLKAILDQGIVEPIRLFCVQLVSNKETHRITKATAQPTLEDAAACIAAVVEAERPATHPTLKGLIHKDVDKTTKELRRCIQSLEAKLSATTPKSTAKNVEGGGLKSKAGSVTAQQKPKPQTKKSTSEKKKTATPKKKPATPKDAKKPSPTTKNNASNSASKSWLRAQSKLKSTGKGSKKKTAIRNW